MKIHGWVKNPNNFSDGTYDCLNGLPKWPKPWIVFDCVTLGVNLEDQSYSESRTGYMAAGVTRYGIRLLSETYSTTAEEAVKKSAEIERKYSNINTTEVSYTMYV